MKGLTGKEKPLKKALIEGDTGYFSEENPQEAAKRGINILIPGPAIQAARSVFRRKEERKSAEEKIRCRRLSL